MDRLDEHYTLTHRVEDKNFSIDRLTDYSLLLLVGDHNVQLCVTDTREGACRLVEDYTLTQVLPQEQQVQSLQHLFDGHTLLMAGYWQTVKLAVKTRKFTLVPESFFSGERLSHYLTMSASADTERDGYYYYRHVQSKAVSVFAADKKLVEGIRSLYPSLNVPVIHHGSALVEGIQANRDFTYYKDLYLHIDQASFSIVVTEDNKLLFYNQFPYGNSQDIVKYTLTVMQEMGMSQNASRAILWGNIPVQSEHFQALYRYVRNLEYGNRPSFLTFSYAFDEIPDHRYFDLYGLHVCET